MWEAMKGLPTDLKVKKVTSAEEKDSVMSLLSSAEVDHQQSSFLYNKVLSRYCLFHISTFFHVPVTPADLSIS